MGWITTGTVNLVNGSNVVTGVGSKFLEDARIGDGFRGPNGALYEVTNIPTNTSLTIQPAYEGATVNAAPYFLVPIEGYVKDSADQLRTATGQIALIPGSKQDKNANLTAFSGLTGAADRLPYFTGAGALSLTTLTGLARNLLDDTTQSGMQSTLGLVKQTSATDTTAGALMAVGAFGIGTLAPPFLADLDQVIQPNGLYFVNESTLGNNPRTFGMVLIENFPTTGNISQTLTAPGNSGGNYRYFRTYNVSTSAWNPWQPMFHTGNILGTVSQSAGVPTGAIIERGSNANGEYVRFADGTQICWNSNHSFGSELYSRLTGTWTYPASFYTALAVSHCVNLNSVYTTGWATSGIYCPTQELSQSSALLHVTVQGQDTAIGWDGVRTAVFAIGRWF